jgi:hypothetical protein
MRPVLYFVGIDAAKAQLDVAVPPSGEAWTVAHHEAGIAPWGPDCRRSSPRWWYWKPLGS